MLFRSADELGGRARPADHCDRDPGDRRDEREQAHADVHERPRELGRLLVIEPEAFLGVHGAGCEYGDRSGRSVGTDVTDPASYDV